MMSEQHEQEKREVAFAAMGQQVVNNKAYQEALLIVKTDIFNKFCSSKAEDKEERDEAWRTMQNMNALEDFLNTLLTTGKMAQQTLDANKDK